MTDRAESHGASRITISPGHDLPTKAARCGFFASWFSGAPPYNLSYARKHAILPTGELALPLERAGYPALHFLCQGGPRKSAKKILVCWCVGMECEEGFCLNGKGELQDLTNPFRRFPGLFRLRWKHLFCHPSCLFNIIPRSLHLRLHLL